MERVTLSGKVVTGSGEGAAFTQLGWARAQFITQLGVDPFPGTLNLILEDPADIHTWANLLAQPSCLVRPPDPQWCDARCFPVRIDGRYPGAIIYPEVPGYPATQVELIAALSLRKHLSLSDGDPVSVEISRPLPVLAAIFDVDGTLVDSLEAYRILAQTVADPLDIEVTREQVRRTMNTGEDFWEAIVPVDWPNRAEVIRDMRLEARRLWPEVLRAHGWAFPGLRQILEMLKSKGALLGIVTGSGPDALEPLRNEGLVDLFSAVITGIDVERRKPDPEGLLKCSAAMDLSPHQAVYIGDSPLDVKASQAAGMASVAVLTGAGDPATLTAEGPQWLIHSLARLTDVLAIV